MKLYTSSAYFLIYVHGGEHMEMESIHQIGKWKVFKVHNIFPVEFVVTNGYDKYYNRDPEVAIRLAEFIYRANFSTGPDLQEV